MIFLKRIVPLLLLIILQTFSPRALMASEGEPNWALWDEILRSHMVHIERNGVRLAALDYAAIRRNKRFATLVGRVESFPLAKLDTENKRKAFYINAYNIFTVRMVLDNWPIESIKDLGNWFSPVWKKDAGRLGGQRVSLDHIEHKILRAMGDPRIHMAIVCASVSCPDLRQEAYRADSIHKQLADQSRIFLANRGKGLRLEGNTALISKIFDWFKEDFVDLDRFMRKYRPGLPKDVEYDVALPYDWSLNGL